MGDETCLATRQQRLLTQPPLSLYRFNRVAWGGVSSSKPRGVIAGGMDSGELDLYDPEAIVRSAP